MGIIDWLLIFLCAFLSDIFWVLYIQSVTEERRIAASNYGVFIYLCSFFGFYLIFKTDLLYVFAYVFGSWLGTYYSGATKKVLKKLQKLFLWYQ